MHIMLFNCYERVASGLPKLLQRSDTNVYLAVSQSDIIRILNTANIDVAVLAFDEIDKGLLQVLQAYAHTQFYLFNTSTNQVSGYPNIHAIDQNHHAPCIQDLHLAAGGEAIQ